MLSIIIPTLNEEGFIENLLKSIKGQSFKDYEVIVSDAGSKDATVEIAKNYGCLVVKGGSPGVGRNNGAKAAHGKTLFFLDSDTVLPEEFLQKTMDEYATRELQIASFFLYPFPDSTMAHIFFGSYNKRVHFLENTLSHGAVGIMLEKNIFQEIGGYDESVVLGEDRDLIRRARKKGKFGIIKSVKILTSDRRFRKEGWIKTGVKYFLCELYLLCIGPIRTDIFKYKFNHYENNNKNELK